ncbi:hypothetical protein, conserved [Plasmodium gonderi]|uniref:Allantoicase domain-containing protein n=1 Tax=Plasmodium gonderi TaxID=77519 RepID=A0A1Y1JCU2_PLAGO|nr:hypothetical protein, conserved [Plasmodium gonderi]GAW79175.1 hypothetical protein, conserved [Plasmodium gonderi]
MSEDKVPKGAYINNPEFPYKNLNIKKIEKIRKSASLGSQFSIHKNPANDELEKVDHTSKQGNAQKYANNGNKKYSKAKNFIERNIEKISSLSKKNYTFIKTKKTCNRSHAVGYDLHKDAKGDIKERTTSIMSGSLLKSRTISGTTGHSDANNSVINSNINNNSNHALNKIPTNYVRHKTTLFNAKNKNTEHDLTRKKAFSTNINNNNVPNPLGNARKFQGIVEKENKQHISTNFERSKTMEKHYDTGGGEAYNSAKINNHVNNTQGIFSQGSMKQGIVTQKASTQGTSTHNHSNALLRKQKSVHSENTVSKNLRENVPGQGTRNKDTDHNKGEARLKQNVQMRNSIIKKNEWVDMKNRNTSKEEEKNKNQYFNAPFVQYQQDKEENLLDEEEKKKKIKEKTLKESSNLISSYQEYELKNKLSNHVINKKIKQENTFESQKSGYIETEKPTHDKMNKSVDINYKNYPRELMQTDERENMYRKSKSPYTYYYSGHGVEKQRHEDAPRREQDLHGDENNRDGDFYGKAELCEAIVVDDINDSNRVKEVENKEVEETQKIEKGQDLQEEKSMNQSELYSNNDDGDGKRNCLEKSISLNDNSSINTLINYNVKNKKEYETFNDKIKLENGISNKLRSSDYTSDVIHNETVKILSTSNEHLDSSENKTNEKKYSDNKNLKEVYENINNNIRAFGELLSKKFANLKRKSATSNEARDLQEDMECPYNSNETINERSECLISNNANSTNEYPVLGGKFLQKDPSVKSGECKSEEMVKPIEELQRSDQTSNKEEENFHFDGNIYNKVKREREKLTNENKYKHHINTHYDKIRDEHEREMIIRESYNNKEYVNRENIHEMKKIDDSVCNEYIKKGDTICSDKSLSDPASVHNAHMLRHENSLENLIEERNPLNGEILNKNFSNSYDYEFSSSRKANHSLSGSNFSPLCKNYSTEEANDPEENVDKAQSDDEDYKSVTEKVSTNDELEEEEEWENEKPHIGDKNEDEQYKDEANGDKSHSDEYNDEEKIQPSIKEPMNDEKKHVKEYNKGYFDNIINENSVEKEDFCFPSPSPPSNKIANDTFLTIHGKDAQKNEYNDSGNFNKLHKDSFTSKNQKKVAEEVIQHHEDMPKEEEGDKQKFLCSSNDIYHIDALKTYNSKLSLEGKNTKNNKLINKNMILKEIFGSNYESSLKNNLNESTNMMGIEEDESVQKEEYEAVEKEEYEAVEKEEHESVEKEEHESVEKEEHESVEKEEYEAVEKEEDEAVEKEEEEMKNYTHKDKIEKMTSNGNIAILSDDKNNRFVSNKPTTRDVNDEFHSQFDKGNSVEKDTFGSELANDEDSLLKRYEENSSPLILSKPLFNDKTSESSYNISVRMGQVKNESINFKHMTNDGTNRNNHDMRKYNEENFLEKGELLDLDNTSDYTEKKTQSNNEVSSEYKEGEYTSEAESDQLVREKDEGIEKHTHDIRNSKWKKHYVSGGDVPGRNSTANDGEEEVGIEAGEEVGAKVEEAEVGADVNDEEARKEDVANEEWHIEDITPLKTVNGKIVLNKKKGELINEHFVRKRQTNQHSYEEVPSANNFVDEDEQDYGIALKHMDEKKKKEIDEEMRKYQVRKDNRDGQYRNFKDYIKGERTERERTERERTERERMERERTERERTERERMERERTERERMEREQMEREQMEREQMEREQMEGDKNHAVAKQIQSKKRAWTKTQAEICEEDVNSSNLFSRRNGEIHDTKKNVLTKYMDKEFLIYKDNLCGEKQSERNKSKSLLNNELLDTHYDNKVWRSKEREFLFDSMSDNYNYIRKGKNGRKNTEINLYENIKGRIEMNEHKESDHSSNNLKSRISDDYYLDYIKNRRKNSNKFEDEEENDANNFNKLKNISNESEFTGKKRKRKNIFENDSITNESKDETNFDLPHNNNEYLDEMKKKMKMKKMDNINSSNISYDNSECSKAAALYNSINETTNSSHTIVSKRSKYILKNSNASSFYDDVPMFFNFVNCCSIVLGSEIIYVTDETYGKCENILKDKPFYTANVERGYYEDCSNDLYNVMNNNLISGIAHYKKYLDMPEKKNIPTVLSEQQNYFNVEKNEKRNEYSVSPKEIKNFKECPGWLTKRRIKKYFDFCIVKLCKPTLIKGIDIDTNNFLGNYAPYVSIEGAYIEDDILMSKESFSKYVDQVKYENKKNKGFMFEKDFFPYQSCQGKGSNESCSHIEQAERNPNGLTDRNGVNDRNDECRHKQSSNNELRKNIFERSTSNIEENRFCSNDSKRLGDNLLNNREEVELVIDGKTYFKRNKYFYEPILIDLTDKSDQEYENYLEILRYNDKFKKLRNNHKPASFVANGNEYRYIDNKLYTLVDVTKEIASRYPGIQKGCLLRSSSPPNGKDRNRSNNSNVKNYQSGEKYGNLFLDHSYNGKASALNRSDVKRNVTKGNVINGSDIHSKTHILHYDTEQGEEEEPEKQERNGKNEAKEEEKQERSGEYEEEEYPFLMNSYNSNMLFLDNDYSVEKKIYNDLHKQYQWVSILEDERMNPGFKNYNHNCFNINTCNKIFTHLIVCLLPDGGINKLRVYGEIKISEKMRKQNYKKTINVCNILDGSNVVYTTDEFYGKSENILIDQNSNYVMGWQTRRLINRPLRYVENLSLNNISSIFFNNNYCIIKLSFLTNIKYIEINTIFYEYNFPICVSIDYCYLKQVHSEEKSNQIQFFNENIHNIQWKQLLPLSYIKGNHINFFTVNNNNSDGVPLNDIISSHLRLNIYPDGGINTIKAYGVVVET